VTARNAFEGDDPFHTSAFNPVPQVPESIMHQTLSEHRVGIHTSRMLTTDSPVRVEPSAPVSPTVAERIKRTFRNPLVLVGITWVVMAVMLAREILAP
jgi:hypothetical protein